MAKKLALVFGIVFLLVGVLGFISNPIVGGNGIFLTDTLHNIVHLLFGIVLTIVAVKSPASSNMALKVSGILYLVLAVLGFLMIGDAVSFKLLGIVTANAADNYLHLVLGIVILASGFTSNSTQMQTM